MVKLYKNVNKVRVAQYLLLSELQDPVTKQVIVDPRLIEAWIKFREALDEPFFITSGYRTAATNKRVKGHRDSGHMKGKCIDGYCHYAFVDDVRKYALHAGFTRVKFYPRTKHWHLGV